MNRRGFLRSIMGVVAAPAALSLPEVDDPRGRCRWLTGPVPIVLTEEFVRDLYEDNKDWKDLMSRIHA